MPREDPKTFWRNATHEDRDRQLNEIITVSAKHTGQWKILIWGMGLFLTILCGFFGAQYSSQQKMTDTVVKIDKKITGYVAAAGARQEYVMSLLEDHEERIRIIEHTHK